MTKEQFMEKVENNFKNVKGYNLIVRNNYIAVEIWNKELTISYNNDTINAHLTEDYVHCKHFKYKNNEVDYEELYKLLENYKYSYGYAYTDEEHNKLSSVQCVMVRNVRVPERGFKVNHKDVVEGLLEYHPTLKCDMITEDTRITDLYNIFTDKDGLKYKQYVNYWQAEEYHYEGNNRSTVRMWLYFKRKGEEKIVKIA